VTLVIANTVLGARIFAFAIDGIPGEREPWRGWAPAAGAAHDE
jgi:hypothetical protein